MVWQDFPLACAAYPEEEPHRSEFEAEAREHVARLSAHPSLVIWNGGNENLWGFEDWGWQEHARRPVVGRRLLPRPVPVDRGRARPHASVHARQPVLPRRHPPERPGPRHAPRVGGLEPRRLHRLPRRRPPLLLRVRLPGAARLGHPRAGGPQRRRRAAAEGGPRLPAAPEGRRRQRQARPRHGAAPRRARRLLRLALGHPAQPGPRGRARRSRTTARGGRARPARSSGSSTTAGRSPRGPPSTATNAASRCGTRCAPRSRTGSSPCRRATGVEVARRRSTTPTGAGSVRSPSAASASTAPLLAEAGPRPSTHRRARSRSSICPTTSALRSTRAPRSSSPSSTASRTTHTWLDDVELDLDPEPAADAASSGSRTATW